MKRMIRRWKSLTLQEVQHKVNQSSPEQYRASRLAEGSYMPKASETIIGKTFSFSFSDGDFCKYYICDSESLVFVEKDAEYSALYQAHEAEPGVYLVHHLVEKSVPPKCRTLVIDENTGLVTACYAQLGNGIEAREVSREFHFGRIIEYKDVQNELHHYTSDLIGKAFFWTYVEGMPPIKHIYTSEYYYTYVMKFGEDCWVASNPADFIKINDHLYIFSFVEERQAGTQGFFLINTETMHDIGSFFGINSEDVFESYTFGAKGEETTMYTYMNM